MDGDIVETAEIENAVVAVNCTGGCHVDFHAALDHGRVGQGKLQLVGYEGLADIFLQQPDLAGFVVGNAEAAYLAALLQLVEGFCHFFRLHQGIRTVQDKHIQIVSAQTLQNAVYRR